MRVISLWQPWATAIALGSKRIETRHWSTAYRRPLAIHAAQRKVISELLDIHCYWHWQGALRGAGADFGNFKLDKTLPFGAIVATARLIDCRPTESFTVAEIETPRKPEGESSDLYNWTERQMGNFEPGRFGWVLSDIRPLAVPIPYRGQQGFFSIPDDLVS